MIKTTSTGAECFTWDGWRLVDSFDGAFAPKAMFVDGRAIDEHVAYAAYDIGQDVWTRYSYVQGPTWNVMKLVAGDGAVVEQYEYGPYGNREVFDATGQPLSSGSAFANQRGAWGRWHDPETGLIYSRHRYLDPRDGRFETRDPAGICSDSLGLGSAYAFAGGAPGRYYDPWGLYTIVVIVTGSEQPADIEMSPEDEQRTFEARASWLIKRDPEGGVIIKVPADGSDPPPPTPVDPPAKPPRPRDGEEPKKEGEIYVEILGVHGNRVDVLDRNGAVSATWAKDTDSRISELDIPGVIREAVKRKRDDQEKPEDADDGSAIHVTVTSCYLGLGARPSEDPKERAENVRKNLAFRLASEPGFSVWGYTCFIGVPPSSYPPFNLDVEDPETHKHPIAEVVTVPPDPPQGGG